MFVGGLEEKISKSCLFIVQIQFQSADSDLS